MSPRQRSLRRRRKPPARLIGEVFALRPGRQSHPSGSAACAAYHWADTPGDVSPRCAGAGQAEAGAGRNTGDEKDRGPSDDAACRSLTAPLLDRDASSRSLPDNFGMPEHCGDRSQISGWCREGTRRETRRSRPRARLVHCIPPCAMLQRCDIVIDHKHLPAVRQAGCPKRADLEGAARLAIMLEDTRGYFGHGPPCRRRNRAPTPRPRSPRQEPPDQFAPKLARHLVRSARPNLEGQPNFPMNCTGGGKGRIPSSIKSRSPAILSAGFANIYSPAAFREIDP